MRLTPLSKLTERKKTLTQTIKVNKIRDEKNVRTTTNTNGIQNIIREYFRNIHSNKLEN
jgi:hypothetical protein